MTRDPATPPTPLGEESEPSAGGDDTIAPGVLDGNAAAGEFAAVLASDPTTVTVHCASCGATQAFGQLHAYLRGPGTVLRCRECESMVGRVAHTGRGTWLDLSGSSSWFIPQAVDPLDPS